MEEDIAKDINAGKCTYLKVTSVNNKEKYATPMSSIYFNYLAWNEIFAQKYGSFNAPAKVPVIKLKPITTDYLDWLETQDSEIYQRLTTFINKYGKRPTRLVLNLDDPIIPETIRPLVDVQEIIYSNLKTLYTTLEQLGISCGNSDKQIIFSDAYHPMQTTN
jgi:hypothetical protein